MAPSSSSPGSPRPPEQLTLFWSAVAPTLLPHTQLQKAGL